MARDNIDNSVSRRKILKNTTLAAGALAAIPTVGTAKSRESDRQSSPGQEKGLKIHDTTVVSEKDNNAIVAVAVSEEQRKSKPPKYSAMNQEKRKNYIFKIDTNGGSASMIETDREQYGAMVSDGGMSAANIEDQLSASESNDIVERWEIWEDHVGECAAYDYDHEFAAVTAEFHKNIDEIAWTAIGAALIALVGASAITGGAAAVLVGGIALAAGLAGIVTDVESVTFGAQEWDKSALGWTQTMYSAEVAPGYHQNQDDLTTISTAPTHPGRF